MKILLPIDGSYHSDYALESVINEPWPKDSTFCVITVAEPMHTLADAALGPFGQTAMKAQEALDDDIHKLLDEAADKLKEKFGKDKVSKEFFEGSPAAHILDKAQNWGADLIVMGSHGTTGYNDEMLGDICSIVMSHAPCSVRIVHYLGSVSTEKKLAAHKPLVTSRLLLAVDQSPKSKVAVESVLNRPWIEGTTAQVLTVVKERSNPMHSRFFQAPEIEQTQKAVSSAEKAEAEKMVKGVADKLEKKFGKGKVTYHVLDGNNARSLILQVAQDWPADLIVIGAHGQDKNIIEHLLGSTARAVVDNAMCSIEIVR
jgi:nucleotide-binding universal stress UspA family protein